MTSFIPSGNPNTNNSTIENDGFFPDIDLDDIRNRTGLTDIFTDMQIATATRDAMIETNSVLSQWRTSQVAESLADVPGATYGNTPEKVHLYLTAISARVRSFMVDTTRDYDSTKSGHDRADALEATSDRWLQAWNEALSRLMARKRTVVELI
ncbi:head completion/stabilization protein [Thalassospira sp. TSL5-1]|uniref:head completion/stabilization protein n=1 Tax=Thalassospira sp. TSL5-1 TaxID=1544451 RepID=UPI00093D8D03|nr:head completion/stabilization protein [Thalassospira sp. TSL5-1]